MTELLEKAFTTISTKFSQQDQDRLAQLMIENIGNLPELLEEEMEERSFDISAVKAIESDKVQSLLKKVANKCKSQGISNHLQ